MRTAITSVLIGMLFLLAGFVNAVEGEFGNQCAMGLAMGQRVNTDCSVNWVDDQGKIYCFSNDGAKTMFLENPTENAGKALDFFSAEQAPILSP